MRICHPHCVALGVAQLRGDGWGGLQLGDLRISENILELAVRLKLEHGIRCSDSDCPSQHSRLSDDSLGDSYHGLVVFMFRGDPRTMICLANFD